MPLTRTASPIDLDYIRPRFWSNVNVGIIQTCWPWKMSTASHGYGQTWDRITVRLTHRVAWEEAYGRIPADLTVDHRCRNRVCCNPFHLRLLSNVENARRNGKWERTHCANGHEYTPENTSLTKEGWRVCRPCRRASRGASR